MSAWVAIAAKEAATTNSLGSGILHGIPAGALDGFAAGAMLTGLCFLMIVAPRLLGRPRLAASLSIWPSFRRKSPAQRDYYAEPGETHAGQEDTYAPPDDTYSLSAESEMIFSGAPAGDDADSASEAADFELIEDFGGHAGADPYAVETAAALVLDAEPVLDLNEAPVEDQSRPETGRGYRSKHRMTDQESGERRPENRRSAPRHAAPSSRFGSRLSGKLATVSLVAARG
jgi:hypothetical protein